MLSAGKLPCSRRCPVNSARHRVAYALKCCASSQHFCPARTPGSHPAAFSDDPAFAVFTQLQLPVSGSTSCLRHRSAPTLPLAELILGPDSNAQLRTPRRLAVSGVTALQQLARSLVHARCLDVKEVLEAVEFVERVRRRVRRGCILDAAAGHGLVGLLLAAVERKVVQKVYLLDHQQPPSHAVIVEVVARLAPWVQERVTYLTCDLPDFAQQLRQRNAAHWNAVERGFCADVVTDVRAWAAQGELGVVAVHACGGLTDTALHIATWACAPVAAMPCCYTGTASRAPLALRRALGVGLAADTHRCYALQTAGCYTAVDFSAIPRAVTPANRIIIGEVGRPGAKQASEPACTSAPAQP